LVFVIRNLIVLLLFGLLYGCTNSMAFIPFDAKMYTEVNSKEIELYNNRLEIGSKYEEIGILKIKGHIDIQAIKERAGSHGADGIVKDQNNYILIKKQKIENNPEVGNDAFSI